MVGGFWQLAISFAKSDVALDQRPWVDAYVCGDMYLEQTMHVLYVLQMFAVYVSSLSLLALRRHVRASRHREGFACHRADTGCRTGAGRLQQTNGDGHGGQYAEGADA